MRQAGSCVRRCEGAGADPGAGDDAGRLPDHEDAARADRPRAARLRGPDRAGILPARRRRTPPRAALARAIINAEFLGLAGGFIPVFSILPSDYAHTNFHDLGTPVDPRVSLALIGHLGNASLAGIGLAGAVYGTLLALLFGFDTGIQAVVARAIGAEARGFAGAALNDALCGTAPLLLAGGGTLLVVQSEFAGPRQTLAALASAGLDAEVVAYQRIPFGPVLTSRAAPKNKRPI